MSPTGSNTIHLFAEANKLAFADRNRYLADPDFVTVPSAALISRDYLQQRSRLIDPTRSMGRATAGEPAGFKRSDYGRDNAPEWPSPRTSILWIAPGGWSA
jgi:gamma-glutamyltranspeptidase/glutathione hydrolase